MSSNILNRKSDDIRTDFVDNGVNAGISSRDQPDGFDNPEEVVVEEEIREFTDSEDEHEFVRRYGDINFQYIKPPRDSAWFIRPHALNFFKDGVLYRTKGERTSTKTELFVDLLYVGIIANLAGAASENASRIAFLKYFLFFVPAWVVWADIKDFTNYYYNGDLSQKLYIVWVLALLVLYANSHESVLDGYSGAALTIVPYMLCRLSLAISLFHYSFFIPEHRPQMRLYFVFILFTCCLWIPVIFIDTRAKIALSIAIMFLEQALFCVVYHPWTKKLMKLTTSTALNIEHEVERFSTFVTIAIGEFLYKIVADSPSGIGFSDKFARAVFMLIIAYVLFWIYDNGGTSKKAIHPIRHSARTAMTWIYAHLPLVASIVLAADAGGELVKMDNTDLSRHQHKAHEKMTSIIRAEEEEEEEGPNMYGLSLFFTGGICVALVSLWVIGHIEHSKDAIDLYILRKPFRISLRLPIAVIILCLSFAEINSTLLMGITALLLVILLVFESVTSTPKHCLMARWTNNNNIA